MRRCNGYTYKGWTERILLGVKKDEKYRYYNTNTITDNAKVCDRERWLSDKDRSEWNILEGSLWRMSVWETDKFLQTEGKHREKKNLNQNDNGINTVESFILFFWFNLI